MSNIIRAAELAGIASLKLSDLCPTAHTGVDRSSPPAILDRAAAELSAALDDRPDRQFLQGMVGRLGAAYPPRAAESDRDLKLWLALITEELGELPTWAIADALPELWRSVRWRPSVADVVQAVRQSAFGASEQLTRIRTIRAERAEIARQEAAERARQEENARWIAERDAAAVAQFGPIGVQVGDFEIMIAMRAELDSWNPALDVLEIYRRVPRPPSDPWPQDLGETLLHRAILGRALKARRERRASGDDVGRVDELLFNRETERARALVADLDARRNP